MKDPFDIDGIFHLLIGLKVTIKDDHSYIGIKKGQKGILKSIRFGYCLVEFKRLKREITFCCDEIERTK